MKGLKKTDNNKALLFFIGFVRLFSIYGHVVLQQPPAFVHGHAVVPAQKIPVIGGVERIECVVLQILHKVFQHLEGFFCLFIGVFRLKQFQGVLFFGAAAFGFLVEQHREHFFGGVSAWIIRSIEGKVFPEYFASTFYSAIPVPVEATAALRGEEVRRPLDGRGAAHQAVLVAGLDYSTGRNHIPHIVHRIA